MDISRFERFDLALSENLTDEIGKILKKAKHKKLCTIGFITTDDFYGMYLSYNYSHDIDEYYDWKKSVNPDFLYQPLVDIVDSTKDIDLLRASDEKWDFAVTLLYVLEKNIRKIPEEVFSKNKFKREDILFFATMGDGDYVEEMLEASVKMFNS